MVQRRPEKRVTRKQAETSKLVFRSTGAADFVALALYFFFVKGGITRVFNCEETEIRPVNLGPQSPPVHKKKCVLVRLLGGEVVHSCSILTGYVRYWVYRYPGYVWRAYRTYRSFGYRYRIRAEPYRNVRWGIAAVPNTPDKVR